MGLVPTSQRNVTANPSIPSSAVLWLFLVVFSVLEEAGGSPEAICVWGGVHSRRPRTVGGCGVRQPQGALLSAPTSSQAPHKGPIGAGLPVASCGLCYFGGGQGLEVQCLLSASQKPPCLLLAACGCGAPPAGLPVREHQDSEPARCRDSWTSVGLLAHLFWNRVRSPQPHSLQPHLVKSVYFKVA